ncbi:unnamed protein product [Owenia fusiformis]|uniref:Uncharacterized protein n=1 Tax=Owenia fusiformis TaxID=6347 RepID=A0A8S4NZS4_OWEFU|nr:unnamed protein product [Owenia fusiformis]
MGCTSTKQEGVDISSGIAPFPREGESGPAVNSNVSSKRDLGSKKTVKSHLPPLKGDLSMKKDARRNRHKVLKDWRNRRVKAAEEMSHKIMDEKELLSVRSLRSRATSQTTSRAPSPTPGSSQPAHFNGHPNGSGWTEENERSQHESNSNNQTMQNSKITGHSASLETDSVGSAETESTNLTSGVMVPELNNGDPVSQINEGNPQIPSITTESMDDGNTKSHENLQNGQLRNEGKKVKFNDKPL